MQSWSLGLAAYTTPVADVAGIAEVLSVIPKLASTFCDEAVAFAARFPSVVVPAVAASVLTPLLASALLGIRLRRANRKLAELSLGANLDVPIIPQTANHDPAIEDDSELQLVGIPISTLIGRIVFPSSHAVGRVGDSLSAIYYTKLGYTKKKSKTSKVHGIDGVYVRYNPRNKTQREVVVIENKINTSGYKRHQLSLEGITSRCHKMLKSEDAAVQETAELILAAMSNANNDRLIRLIVRHDLRIGKSTRFCVDEAGNSSDKHGEWQNEHQMTRVLRNAIKKGLAWSSQHANGTGALDAPNRI
jgi:hypothetical protein